MFEMSIEKEAVQAGDGLGAVLSQPPPRSPSGRRKTASPPSTVSVSIGGPFVSNMVLAELTSNSASPGLEEVSADTLKVKDGSKSLQLQNGVQSHVVLQPHLQRLSKRRCSMTAGFKHPASGKRRRRANSECDPVLPTNFLLGGNIFDPLNLNSLLDEEVNKVLNAETPKSSPLPAKNREPVEILIPRDITDPLNLSGRGAGGGVLVSPIKNGGKRRHRYRHHGSTNGGMSGQLDSADPERSKDAGGNAVPLFTVTHVTKVPLGVVPEASREGAVLSDLHVVEESPRPYELNTSINCRDEVVPPILPRRRSHPSTSCTSQAQAGSSSSTNTMEAFKLRRRRRTISRSERLAITPTPAITQASTRRSQTFHTPVVGGATRSHCAGSCHVPQTKHKPRCKFQYGAYSNYYGYQTPKLSRDPRLAFLRPEWFRGKKVLDMGCNTGHMTLAIARNWSPAHILGLDINGRLVHAARQNLRHFLSELQRLEVRQDAQRGDSGQGKFDVGISISEGARRPQENKDKLEDSSKYQTGQKQSVRTETEGTACRKQAGGEALMPLMGLDLLRPFPVSFRLCRGPIVAPPLLPTTLGIFPNNVSFMKGNYVLESDADVMSQRVEYDVILCLNVTKWVHLHWGDVGVQRLFKRAYRHLTPGGVLILEAQPWSSYSKRKRLTETTYRNYNSIRLRPDQFSSYLTSEVGFTSYEIISPTSSCSKGLQRPMYLFHKGANYSKKSVTRRGTDAQEEKFAVE